MQYDISIIVSADSTLPATIIFSSIGFLTLLLICLPLLMKWYLKYRNRKAEELMIMKDSQYQMKVRINEAQSSGEKRFSEHLKNNKQQTLY